MTSEALRQSITSQVNTNLNVGEYFDVTAFENLVYEQRTKIKFTDDFEDMSVRIWSKAIQAAVDTYKNVYIPDVGHDMYLDCPIIMKSDCHLKVHPCQRIHLMPDTNTCLIKNENVLNPQRDSDISVCGGIWSTLSFTNANGNTAGRLEKDHPLLGARGVMIFTNIENLIIKDVVFDCCHYYALQLGDCRGFLIENIDFNNHRKDGVHLNGPAEYGIIKNLRGDNLDDDFVAFNAWDWNYSAITRGNIHHIIVEDIKSSNNEIRLLPGEKVNADDSRFDCDISDCIFKDISGAYTFKLYNQPKFNDPTDCSGRVGLIKNVFFENIVFDRITSSGFSNIPICGLFDVGSNCEDIYIKNVTIKNTKEEFAETGLTVMSVGPLSATWKGAWKDEPEKWTEIFSPDDVVSVDNVLFEDIFLTAKDGFLEKITDEKTIIKATKQSVNPDYPRTTPRGGTGYGVIRSFKIQ